MTFQTTVLHLICGKIAAGKSTLAATLAAPDNTVLISEDAWLSALFGEDMSTAQDFVRCSQKLRGIMGPHVQALLAAGTSVVLDFQANTVESRTWMRGLIYGVAADHTLHVLNPPDAVCLARLKARNESGTHPFTVTEAQFHQFAQHFVMPSPDEGFKMVIYDS